VLHPDKNDKPGPSTADADPNAQKASTQ
jgi:hypothetical protein